MTNINAVDKRGDSYNLKNSRKKHYIFLSQLIFIVGLLIVWLICDTIRQNNNLWILFFYNFPSHFVFALIPHEPVVYYFGKFYHPLTVSIVSIAGTLLTERLNYSVVRYLSEFKPIEKVKKNKFTDKLVKLFKKAPFTALCIAGFTPVPFYPFRIIVVFANYPVIKYLLAVFVSRTPRYYIISLIGQEIQISNSLLIAIFIVLVIAAYLPLLRDRFKKEDQ